MHIDGAVYFAFPTILAPKSLSGKKKKKVGAMLYYTRSLLRMWTCRPHVHGSIIEPELDMTRCRENGKDYSGSVLGMLNPLRRRCTSYANPQYYVKDDRVICKQYNCYGEVNSDGTYNKVFGKSLHAISH